MSSTPPGLTARLSAWWGIGADWQRDPADPARAYRNDLWLGAGLVVMSLVGTELARSIGLFEGDDTPVWLLYLLAGAGAVPLAWRRRFPLLVLVVVYLHFLVVGLTVPMVTQLAPLQVVYFVALFSAVAWARDRVAMALVVAAALLAMFLWVAWQFAAGSGAQGMVDQLGLDDPHPGLIGPFVAMAAYTWLLNFAYFYGAVVAGQLRWHSARSRATLAEQADTIARQSEALQQQAVVRERLRIARELHDVVAHHVSVIGIQAAAARRLLEADPAAAARPLATIEGESREAVTQMRGLLGTLRGLDGEAPGDPAREADEGRARAPEPGLADIPALAEADDGLDVEVRVVEEPVGAVADVPGPVGLSLYRSTQEALSNVRRHSTARRASVVMRVDRRPAAAGSGLEERFAHGFVEVEVLDEGRPRASSAGTGMGLLGLRERVATHGGVAEIGPRATGGYRVRVRLPLPEVRS